MRNILLTAAFVLLPWQAGAQIGNPAGLAPGTQVEKPGTPSPDQNNYQDRLFIQLSAVGGLAEIDLGKLAANNAMNASVKQFAQRLVDDHQKANDKLKLIAQQDSISWPAKIDAENSKTRAELEKLKGRQFDRAYLAAQVVEHQKTAQLLAWEIGQGQNTELQRFASEGLPNVLEHLRMTRDLAAQTPVEVSHSNQKR
jgi:putative membrane protein